MTRANEAYDKLELIYLVAIQKHKTVNNMAYCPLL